MEGNRNYPALSILNSFHFLRQPPPQLSIIDMSIFWYRYMWLGRELIFTSLRLHTCIQVQLRDTRKASGYKSSSMQAHHHVK
jgi:hypothetical protein